jgi:very-short-patch-repair endonuclease
VDKKTSIQRARQLRNNLTDAEQKLWYELRGKQIKGYKFRRQVTIENYIVDFLSHDLNLIIEVDGGQHAENEIYDNERTEFLKQRGYKVLRFWNNEVLGDLDAVLEKIYGEIGEVPPP